MIGRTAARVALTLGYLALAGAVVGARQGTPGGYQVSIYTTTPETFWIGLGLAVLTATVGLAASASRATRLAAATLVVLVGLSLAGLPVLRGYYYYGGGDSLTHLGWARELADGSLSPWRLLYPGVHEVAIALSVVAERSLRRTMLFAVLAFVGLFLASLPLVVDRVGDRRGALVVGAFVAALLVPFNVISTHLLVHPSSQAIAFSSVVLLLLCAYLGAPGSATVRNPVTGVGALLALTAVVTVLVHPQQAANLLLIFVAVAVVQWVARVWRPDGPVAAQRPVYLQSALLLAAFALWTPRFQRTGRNVSAIVYNVMYDSGSSEVVSQKSTSLTAVGGSIPELFAKLFLVDVVLSLFAGLVVLVAALGWFTDVDDHRTAIVRQFGVAVAALSVLFLLVYVGGPGDMYFRYHGFLMVPVSVLAAVSLIRTARAVPGGRLSAAGSVGLAVPLVVLLVLAALAAFPSPYIYQPSPQVSEPEYEGHEHAFAVREANTKFTAVRGGPVRYVDAVYGSERARTTLGFPGYEDAVLGPDFNTGLGCRYRETRYLVISDGEVDREVGLYRSLRYNRTGFRRLETDPGVNRVVDNGGFELYYLYAEGPDADPGGFCEESDGGSGAVERTDRPHTGG